LRAIDSEQTGVLITALRDQEVERSEVRGREEEKL